MTVSAIILFVAFAAIAPGGKDLGHNGPLKVSCIECHTRLALLGGAPPLRNDVGALCVKCHQRHHGIDDMRAHPVSAVPSMRVPPDMLLDSKGRIGCVTCHAFHGEYQDENGERRFYLRRSPGKAFCYSCHKKLPGRLFKEIKP